MHGRLARYASWSVVLLCTRYPHSSLKSCDKDYVVELETKTMHNYRSCIYRKTAASTTSMLGLSALSQKLVERGI